MKTISKDPQVEIYEIITEGNPAIKSRFPEVDSFIPYIVVPSAEGCGSSMYDESAG